MKSDDEIKFKDLPEEVKKFIVETDKHIKEGKIKPTNERTVLKNSLFPTLVKRVIRRN